MTFSEANVLVAFLRNVLVAFLRNVLVGNNINLYSIFKNIQIVNNYINKYEKGNKRILRKTKKQV